MFKIFVLCALLSSPIFAQDDAAPYEETQTNYSSEESDIGENSAADDSSPDRDPADYSDSGAVAPLEEQSSEYIESEEMPSEEY